MQEGICLFPVLEDECNGIPLGRSRACATEGIRKNIYCERGKRRYNGRERFIAGGQKSEKKKKCGPRCRLGKPLETAGSYVLGYGKNRVFYLWRRVEHYWPDAK